jgi:hypothetical protein
MKNGMNHAVINPIKDNANDVTANRLKCCFIFPSVFQCGDLCFELFNLIQ